MPLDAPGDPVEADLVALEFVTFVFRIRRKDGGDFSSVHAKENSVANRFRELLPRRVEREVQNLRETVNDTAIPGIRIVFVGFFEKAAATNTTLWVGHQQFGMCDLMNPQTATGPAGTLGIVEHKVLRLDAAVHQMVSGAAERLVEAFRL